MKGDYNPIYSTYNMESGSERIRMLNTRFLIYLLIAAGCWCGGSLLLLMVPKTAYIIYVPLKIVYYVGKFATIIGWPIWAIIEIIGIIEQHHEK